MKAQLFAKLKSLPSVLTLCFLLLLFSAIRYLRSSEPLGLDQGLFAYFGQNIPQGDIPYKDVWDSKPPGIFYLYAIAFLLFGDSISSIYLFESLYLAISALFLYRLSRYIFNVRTALIASLTFIIFSNAPLFEGFWASAQAEVFMGLPIMAGLYLTLKGEESGKSYLLLPAGFLLGISVCLKLTAALLVLCFIVYLSLVHCQTSFDGFVVRRFIAVTRAINCATTNGATLQNLSDGALVHRPSTTDCSGPPEGKKRKVSYLYFLSGLALPLVTALVYFKLQGALSDLLASLITYKYYYAREIGRNQDLLKASIYQYANFAKTNSTVWALSSFGCIHLMMKKHSPISWLILLWYLLSFAIVWVQRQFAGYHFIILVTPVSLMTGYGAVALLDYLVGQARLEEGRSVKVSEELGRSRLLWASLKLMLPTGLICLVLYFDARAYYKYYSPNIDYALNRISKARYWRSFDRGSISFSDNLAVAEYVKRNTSEDDYILVWGLAPAIYYLAGRKAATKYVFHHVLLTETAPLSINFPVLESRRKEFMERVGRRRPKYIVIGLNDRNSFEPLDSYRQMLNFPEFKSYVFKNYRLEKRMRNFLLARRIEEDPGR